MINTQYLAKEKIKEVYTIGQSKPYVKYYIWEDFIDPKIYKLVEDEILQNECKILDTHVDGFKRVNKTVSLQWEYLAKLFDFFESSQLEKYLSLYLWVPVKKEFYIPKDDIEDVLWKYFHWAIAQLYETGDHFDWHVDGPFDNGSLGAFTYYLWWYKWNWKTDNGGNLELWVNQGDEISAYDTIPYKKNTLVFICGNENAYHRVTPLKTDDTRLSIQSTIMRK